MISKSTWSKCIWTHSSWGRMHSACLFCKRSFIYIMASSLVFLSYYWVLNKWIFDSCAFSCLFSFCLFVHFWCINFCFYLTTFYYICYYHLKSCLCSNERWKENRSECEGCREELGRKDGGGTIIRIYYVTIISIFYKRKKNKVKQTYKQNSESPSLLSSVCEA